MNARMAAKYQFLQNIESKQVVHELLSVQGKYLIQIFHRYTISVTYTLAYGERIKFIDDLTKIISANVESTFPGQHIAKRSLFIVISCVLCGFNITHA